MNWFKKLLASKISITIVYPDAHSPSTTPKVVEEKIIHKMHQSNIRFVEEREILHNGEEITWYFTQQYSKGDWSMVSGTLSKDKVKAMDLHLKVLEYGSLEPKKIKTVLWQGLSSEETKVWVELQK